MAEITGLKRDSSKIIVVKMRPRMIPEGIVPTRTPNVDFNATYREYCVVGTGGDCEPFIVSCDDLIDYSEVVVNTAVAVDDHGKRLEMLGTQLSLLLSICVQHKRDSKRATWFQSVILGLLFLVIVFRM